MKSIRKPVTREEALLKMADLCARSEQCVSDLDRKLRLKGLSIEDRSYVIGELVKRGFLDMARFARSFTNDKVRFSAWGKNKIRAALLAKRVESELIDKALKEVDPRDYADALERAMRAGLSRYGLDGFEDRRKLLRYVLSRGFGYNEIVTEIRKLIAQSNDEAG